MVIPTKTPYRKGKRILSGPSTPPPAVAPVLTGATFEPDGPNMNLIFDRAIDISGVDVSQFVIRDGPGGHLWTATGSPTPIADNWVQLPIEQGADYTGDDTLLEVTADNGIIAAEGGGAWAGCEDVELPLG